MLPFNERLHACYLPQTPNQEDYTQEEHDFSGKRARKGEVGKGYVNVAYMVFLGLSLDLIAAGNGCIREISSSPPLENKHGSIADNVAPFCIYQVSHRGILNRHSLTDSVKILKIPFYLWFPVRCGKPCLLL